MKSLVNLSRNSVRFEKFSWELAFRLAEFCETLSHSVRYGMYSNTWDGMFLVFTKKKKSKFSFSFFSLGELTDNKPHQN